MDRNLLVFFMLNLTVATAFLQESSPSQSNAVCGEDPGYMYGTNDIDSRWSESETHQSCCDWCTANPNCKAYTYSNDPSLQYPSCWLKDDTEYIGECDRAYCVTGYPSVPMHHEDKAPMQQHFGKMTMKCPGSGAWLGHAKTQVTAIAKANCADVKAEILARIGAQNGWVDPHNGGIYSVLSSSDTEIETKRTTNPKTSFGHQVYTDKQSFTLSENDGACEIAACSESQGTSLKDFSTNYCDIRNLYCGSADGCKPVLHDFTSDQQTVDASSGQHDWSQCVVKSQSLITEINV